MPFLLCSPHWDRQSFIHSFLHNDFEGILRCPLDPKMKIFFFFFTSNFIMSTHAFVLLYFIFRTMRLDNGLFKINLEMAIFEYDLENEISVCVRNWELKTCFEIQILKNQVQTWKCKTRKWKAEFLVYFKNS